MAAQAEAAAELETLREGSKELHEEMARLKFAMQQKDVEHGQLQLRCRLPTCSSSCTRGRCDWDLPT